MANTQDQSNSFADSFRSMIPVRGSVLACALAVSAYAMSATASSESNWWLGWVSLFPIFYAIRVLRPLHAAAAGSFWGACVFSAASAMHPGLIGGPAALGLLVLVPGIYAAIGAALTRQIGFSPYLLALGWMGVELLLSPLGLHNGLLVATQGDAPLLQAVGSFTGYAVLAFAVAYLNAMLFTVVSDARIGVCSLQRISIPGDGIRRLAPAEVEVRSSPRPRPSNPRAPPLAG